MIIEQGESTVETLAEFDRQPPTATVEVDRFCDECGYNLRTQPVRRDARTAVLLVRCPECGRFHAARDAATAGRAWLRRLGTLLLFLWVFVIIGGTIGLGGLQVAVSFIPLETLTTYNRPMPRPVPVWSAQPPIGGQAAASRPVVFVTKPGRVGPMKMYASPAGTLVFRRTVRQDFAHFKSVMALSLGLSFALGLLFATLATVIVHHWPRWGYFVPVALVPLIAGTIAWFMWRADLPDLSAWSTAYIVGQSAVHFAGGLLGVWLGRPFARGLVSLLLPPKVRQILAFLWIVDGKQPPRATRA